MSPTPDSLYLDLVLPLTTAQSLPGGEVHGNKVKPNLWALCPAHLPEILHIEEVKGLKELTPLEAKLLTAGRQEGADVLKAQELWAEQK